VPITILRAQGIGACLFFGKIGGGRGLVRSRFLFPANGKRAVRLEKLRAAILPWVFPGFSLGSSQRTHKPLMLKRPVSAAHRN